MWYNFIGGGFGMRKGTRIFLMFFFLLGFTIAIYSELLEDYDLYFSDDVKLFLIIVGIDLLLSVILIVLWDYVVKIMDRTDSKLWRVIKAVIVSIAWAVALIVSIFLIAALLVDLINMPSEFIFLVVIIWGVITISNAIKSLKGS